MTFDFGSIEKHLPNWLLPSVLIISAALNLIGSIYDTVKLQPTINKLTKENESLKTQIELIQEDVKDFFNGYLYRLSLKLEFGKNNNNNERATIYLHDSVSHFIPFVRFSKNPKFHKQGRTQYLDNEGCIAEGWQHGWHFENNLGKREDTYKRNNLKKYNINNKTIDKMTMKSRLYAVKRIDADNGKHLGVIVIESTDLKRYKEDDLKVKIEQQEKDLAESILILKEHIPSLSNAKKRGF